MKARQGPTACEGMAVPMEKPDHLVADRLGRQRLQRERLETILSTSAHCRSPWRSQKATSGSWDRNPGFYRCWLEKRA